MTEPTTLFLIDGSSYLYRAYHALPPLTNARGEPTGAVYGVANMLRKMIHREKPEYIAIVFDPRGKTARHAQYTDYKAHRPPMPEDLQLQIQPLHQLIEAMGLPLLCVEGIEADDVIATLAHQASAAGWHTVISTIDKDMAQLVSDRITLMNDMTQTRLDPHGVIEKFGVLPTQMVDYLALIGDTADNVPGVPGVGPKTAVKWLQEFQSVETLLVHADRIKNKVGENLRAHIAQLKLAQQLVTLDTAIPLTVGINALKKKPTDHPQLITLLTALEFRSWLNDEKANNHHDLPVPIVHTVHTAQTEPIAQPAPPHTPLTHFITPQYRLILTLPALQTLIEALKQAPYFAIDTETTSLNTLDALLVGISIACNPQESFYIPVGHDYTDAPAQLDRSVVCHALKPVLNDPKKIKITHNYKYDLAIFKKNNLIDDNIHHNAQGCEGVVEDTMLMSYILNSTATRHSMDRLAAHYLHHQTIPYEAVTGTGAKQIGFNQVPLEAACVYAAEDAAVTLALYEILKPQLIANPELHHVYETIDRPLVPILEAMEHRGVQIDAALLNTQSQRIAKRLEILTQEAHLLGGEAFNLDSPKQLIHILYEKLSLPVFEKTPKGQPSTAESTLQQLAVDYELPKILLEHRHLRKIKSTYTDTLPQEIHPSTHRVHTSFHQAVTATGRLSSSHPNLQNIPIRTEEGQQIRRAFIAAPGAVLISCDYSQVELRIMAALSQDRGLCEAFANHQDIHRSTAAEIFGISPEQVTSEQRRDAKAVNFGLIYGMSAFGLAKQLNISRAMAEHYIQRYFARYPGVKQYMNAIVEQAKTQGYVQTLFGRRLYIPNIQSRNKMLSKAAERLAINAPMQGSAADMIKRAMIAVDQALQPLKDKAFLILQVHDELLVETQCSEQSRVENIVKTAMEHAATLSVPLEVTCQAGLNWQAAHA
jgi:DNA polymerase-1